MAWTIIIFFVSFFFLYVTEADRTCFNINIWKFYGFHFLETNISLINDINISL